MQGKLGKFFFSLIVLFSGPLHAACAATGVDLWFFNDESGSVSPTEFVHAKTFMQSVANSLTLSSTDFQLGVVGWGTDADVYVRIPLKDSASDFTTALSSYSKGNYSDHVGTTLEYAYNNFFYNATHGARSDRKKLIIYLTDVSQVNGGQPQADALIATADNIRANGDDIIFVLVDLAATAYEQNTRSISGVYIGDMFLAAADGDASKIVISEDYAVALISDAVVAEASDQVCTSALAITAGESEEEEEAPAVIIPNSTAVSAMVNTTKRFAHTQIEIVSGRMEWLRRHKHDENKSVQGVNVRFANPDLNKWVHGTPRSLESYRLASVEKIVTQYAPNPTQILKDAKTLAAELAMSAVQKMFGKVNFNPRFGPVFHAWHMWSSGQILVGKDHNKDASVTNKSDTFNVALGFDRLIRHGMVGFAINGSKDDLHVVGGTERQKVYGMSVSVYSGIDAPQLLPMEVILGAGLMDIDSRRMDTAQSLKGSRDAHTVFSSVKILKKVLDKGPARIAPYGNVEGALIDLSGFRESGGSQALVFHSKLIKQVLVTLGLDASYRAKVGNGHLTPFTRLEYAHDLSPESSSEVNYVGSPTHYQLTTDKNAQVNWSARVGTDYIHRSGASSSLHYEHRVSVNRAYSNALRLKIAMAL